MCIYVCICICFTLAYFLRKKCYLSLKVTTHYWPSNLGLQKSGNNKIKIDCAYQFNIWRQSNMIFCLRHTQSFSFHVFWTYIRLHPLSFFKLRIFGTCIIFFNGWIIYNALRMTDQTWYFPVPQTVWMTCLDHHSQRHILNTSTSWNSFTKMVFPWKLTYLRFPQSLLPIFHETFTLKYVEILWIWVKDKLQDY